MSLRVSRRVCSVEETGQCVFTRRAWGAREHYLSFSSQSRHAPRSAMTNISTALAQTGAEPWWHRHTRAHFIQSHFNTHLQSNSFLCFSVHLSPDVKHIRASTLRSSSLPSGVMIWLWPSPRSPWNNSFANHTFSVCLCGLMERASSSGGVPSARGQHPF